MFGYVIPYKPELKLREYDVFRSYYCGLCNQIGKKSQPSRFLLTYDMAFMGLLLSSVYFNTEHVSKRLCPFKLKKIQMIEANEYLSYAADINILLSNRKLLDNYQDERSIMALFLSKIVATKNYSNIALEKIPIIDYNLKQIYELENKGCTNIDEISHYFGELTSALFRVKDDVNGRILSSLGYNLGKWIYIIDAYDDLIGDIKDKKYNPYNDKSLIKEITPQQYRQSLASGVEYALYRCLDEISKAFELLTIHRNKGLIENIIYLGMRVKTDSILGRKCEDEQSIRNTWSATRCFGGRD